MPRPLLLVPTPLERDRLAALGAPTLQLAGFGPLAAGTRTAMLLAQGHYDRVVLMGIAGTYDPQLVLGTASSFGRVRLDGLGAGEGERFGALEFPQVTEAPPLPDGSTDVREELPLANEGPALVTVCAAARGRDEVERRLARHAGAVGEDMEAFGVALAAHLAQVPLHVVRGWSNRAGDGDVRGWKIDEALGAALHAARPLWGETA